MKSFILVTISIFIFTGCSNITKKFGSSQNEQKVEQKEEPKNEKQKSDKNQTLPQAAENKDISTKKSAGSTKGIDDLSYDISTFPADLDYEGKIVGGARWKDANGQNYLVITETSEQRKKGKFQDFVWDKELYAYQYISGSDGYKLLWKIQDFVKDCEFDLTLKFIKSSLTITDLNDNGIAESTFMYQMSCKSDVSPDDIKLIMHENDIKYAIRGMMNLNVQGKRMQDGKMVVDRSFDDAPAGFLDYAKSQWKKFDTQSY